MRATTAFVLAAAMAVCGFAVGTWRGGSTSTVSPGEGGNEPPLPDRVTLSADARAAFGLQTAPARQQPLVRAVHASGLITFNELRLARLHPLIGGRVQAVEASIGQHVAAGQRLALLDSVQLDEARHNVVTAGAAVQQSAAEVDTARRAYERAVDLVRSGALAPSEVERRRAALALADATRVTRNTELRHAEEMLTRYNPAAPDASSGGVSLPEAPQPDALGAVVAPFAGTVLSIGASPGELVDTTREMFSLADLSTLWAEANVAERDLGALRSDQPCALAVAAYPDRRFVGRVAFLADQIDPRSGTGRVRCRIPNEDEALKPNMFADVTITVPLGRDGVVVPDTAIQTIDDASVAFSPTGRSGEYRRRDLRLGRREGDLVEVEEGLDPGETVVTQGSFQVKAAMLRSRVSDD